MDWEYVYFCEHEIPGYPFPGSCGEPAVARVWWDVEGIGVTNAEEMYVCQEHLDAILLAEVFQPAEKGEQL